MTTQTISAAYYRGNKSFAVEQAAATAPGPGEVAIRVAYCGICGTDMHVYHGNMDARVGLNRVIGHEMSGVVEAVGEGVDTITPGQKVVVRPLDHCGECPACKRGHQHICQNLKFWASTLMAPCKRSGPFQPTRCTFCRMNCVWITRR